MHKFLSFAHNVFGVFLIIGVFTVAASAVLSLSPISLQAQPSQQVAGAVTGQAVSNVQPLSIKDKHLANEKFLTQLVKQDNGYAYLVKRTSLEESTGSLGNLEVTNYNLVPVKLLIDARVPGEVRGNLVILAKVGNAPPQQIFAPNPNVAIDPTVTLPAESTMQIELEYYVTNKIYFPVELSLVLIDSK